MTSHDRGPQRFIEEMVALWQQRLGLSHWEIVIEWDTPADEANHAEVKPEDDYDRATILIDKVYPTWTPAHAERIIIHELLHVFMRDLDTVNERMAALLRGGARTLAEDWYEHEVEGVVDRLSVVLLTLSHGELWDPQRISA